MARARIAGITVGQAPRTDMTADLESRLAPTLELVQYGALDGLTAREAERGLAPGPGDEMLVSRMRDGSQVTFSGTKVLPLVQARIDQAEREGTRAIVVLCTGSFPEMRHEVPLIYPQPLLHAVARALAGGRRMAVMVPEPSQEEQARGWWGEHGVEVEVISASPYAGIGGVREAAAKLRGSNDALLCLDCMGFTTQMRDAAREASGLDVLLPRTLVASVVSELLG
ncbi:MAG: AroM family protein [Coriobacteriaceae bacterium]|nr:AroM family protein [Coriobacteriaceae bacterium]